MRNVEVEELQQVPWVVDDVDDDLEEAEPIAGEEPHTRGEWVIAPIPSRSPLLGWQVRVPVMYLYRPRWADEDDRAWITGGLGLYTEDGGWGAGVFHRMSLGGDRWRMSGSIFTADFDYRFFGIGGGSTGSIPVNQAFDAYYARVLRRVAGNLFVGVRFSETSSRLRLALDGPLPPDFELPDFASEVDLATLTPQVQLDSRDDEFFPGAGLLGEASVALNRDWLGSDSDFERYAVALNAYRSVSERGIVASRVAFKYLDGDAPFFMFPAFGAGSDLRGYDTGVYRDRFLFAMQSEYRHRLSERLRGAVFAGIGTTASDFAGWDESLWSVGAGLRWVLARENQVAMRFDVARGRDDTIFYVGLGEAF